MQHKFPQEAALRVARACPRAHLPPGTSLKALPAYTAPPLRLLIAPRPRWPPSPVWLGLGRVRVRTHIQERELRVYLPKMQGRGKKEHKEQRVTQVVVHAIICPWSANSGRRMSGALAVQR
mmetsp:Transcript_13598/g.38432  ORF Transcript_13598/g.38432 Transcript_13598/m.38432 type:complete len:121 (-) Transcript_13598:515-877(-)